jgi:hypothetical protein
MTARLLEASDWPRLEATGMAADWRTLPAAALVLVVEDDAGVIVGCEALLPCWHWHGLWVAPPHRGRTAVFRRLWRGVHEIAAALGIREVLTGSGSRAARRILRHVGAQVVPGGTYVVALEGKGDQVCRSELPFR